MDYEKKYKETFKRAKQLLETSVAFDRFTIEKIFPELKESEDERIRKGLIKAFGSIGKKEWGGVNVKNAIAWLEKQCEQKPTDKVEPKFHEGEWLCENEPNNYARFIQILEIVDIQGKERYRISRDIHNDEDIVEFDFVEKYYHNFDIEDAKDGDVLNSPSNRLIWIYKDNEHYHACVNMNYVTDNVATDDLLSIPNDACPATKDEQTILFARMKESGYEWDAKLKQLRKIEDGIEIPYGAKDSELMEASYNIPKGFYAEIDKDKVVIKKGEKPTEWSEKYIADVFEKVGLAKIAREQSNDALTIALQDAMIELSKVTLQQKPSWSEEDEYWSERLLGWLNTLINYIHYDSMVSLDLRRERIQQVEQIKTWLNSIKDRVGCEANCTTTKKWSEENIATISRVISIVKWAAYSDHSHPILNDEGATALVERLKSLKERSTWKPSDEQMDALQYVYRNFNPPLSDKLGWDSLLTLELLYQDLKKLK